MTSGDVPRPAPYRSRVREHVLPRGLAAAALLAVAALITVPSPTAAAPAPAPGTTTAADLPTGAPPALYRAEPTWPAADGWPGADDFPRTSGTGRLVDGALLWTDWLYDDHGARTAPVTDPAQTAGSPSFGGYGYSDPEAHGNGADVFRAGVLLRDDATYWRVDWTTLADASVPLAVWTFDRDGDTATGTSAWPVGAELTSPGVDTALVVGGSGARLLSLPDETVVAEPQVTVDLEAQ